MSKNLKNLHNDNKICLGHLQPPVPNINHQNKQKYTDGRIFGVHSAQIQIFRIFLVFIALESELSGFVVQHSEILPTL